MGVARGWGGGRGGGWRMWSYCLMGMEFYLLRGKQFCGWLVVMVAQQCEYPELCALNG